MNRLILLGWTGFFFWKSVACFVSLPQSFYAKIINTGGWSMIDRLRQDPQKAAALIIAALDQNQNELAEVLITTSIIDFGYSEGVWGRTLLLKAIEKGDLRVAEEILDSGIDPNQFNTRNGRTPLIEATLANSPTAIKLLLKYDAFVNLTDDNGMTALWLAVNSGLEECVGLLLAAGADPNKPDKQGKTPLMTAISRNNLKIVKILLKSRLLRINKRNSHRQSALGLSVRSGHAEITKLLLEAGADLSRERFNLIEAIEREDVDTAKLLIEYGIDVNVGRDRIAHCTPLMLAIRNPLFEELALMMIERGADLEAESSRNERPLSLAIQYRRSRIEEALVVKGAHIQRELFIL